MVRSTSVRMSSSQSRAWVAQLGELVEEGELVEALRARGEHGLPGAVR